VWIEAYTFISVVFPCCNSAFLISIVDCVSVRQWKVYKTMSKPAYVLNTWNWIVMIPMIESYTQCANISMFHLSVIKCDVYEVVW
jgi:hypothetical protein